MTILLETSPSSLVFPGIVLLLIVCLIGKIIHGLYFSSHCHIPGPRLSKISSLYLAYHDFQLTRNETIYSWHEKYGPVVLIAPGEVSFSRPGATRLRIQDAATLILNKAKANFDVVYGSTSRHPKSDYFARFATYGEWPTFTVKSYEEHREKRRLTSKLFQSTTVYSAVYINPIRERAKTFLGEVEKDIRTSSTIDLFERLTLYIFDNMTNFAYGPRHCTKTIETDCEERSMLQGLRECEIWNNRLYDMPVLYFVFQKTIALFTSNAEFLQSEHELTQWNSTVFAEATQDPSTHSDSSLLRYLLQARTRNGTRLTQNYIASEMLDNLNGAQTTTTAALTYVFWNLARNPGWQRAVRNELAAFALQDDGMASFADINNAPVLDACIRESYRVNPISSGRAERIVPFTQEYDETMIPAGTIVSTSTIAMHRSAAEFSSPRTFDPNRWLHASKEQLKAMEACYMPFGKGTRVCIGRALATVQIKMLVGAFLLRYRLEVDPESKTNEATMRQLSTQDALPWGLRCDLKIIPET